jgi:hypothetical protein
MSDVHKVYIKTNAYYFGHKRLPSDMPLETTGDGSLENTYVPIQGGSGSSYPVLETPNGTLRLIGVNDSGVLITTQTADVTATTLTLFSPDNTEWEVTVTNAGALQTTEI